MKKKKYFSRGVMFVISAIFAFLFLLPTVLTISNSFMEQSEINANYGMIFSNITSDSKTYISDSVTLKFIPDKVSPSQYITALIKSPDYLFKFWNSVMLVIPLSVSLFSKMSLQPPTIRKMTAAGPKKFGKTTVAN